MNDEIKAELMRSLGAKGVGEADVLGASMLAVLTDGGAPLEAGVEGDGETRTVAEQPAVTDLLHEAGELLDLLDEAGWYFTRVPAEPDPHPATPEQRLQAFQAIPLQPLDVIDVHARWLATGDMERPEEAELRDALDELDAIETDDEALSATAAALDKVAGAARMLVGGR